MPTTYPAEPVRRAILSGWQERLAWAEWLDVYGNVIRESHLPLPERVDVDALVMESSLPFGIAGFLIPNILSTVAKTDTFTMHSRMALVALAWESYRDETLPGPQIEGSAARQVR